MRQTRLGDATCLRTPHAPWLSQFHGALHSPKKRSREQWSAQTLQLFITIGVVIPHAMAPSYGAERALLL